MSVVINADYIFEFLTGRPNRHFFQIANADNAEKFDAGKVEHYKVSIVRLTQHSDWKANTGQNGLSGTPQYIGPNSSVPL